MYTFPTTFDGVDHSVLNWAQQFVGQNAVADWLLVALGQWLVYLVPIVLLGIWFWLRYGRGVKDWAEERINLIELAVAGVLGWQGISNLVKLVYYRDRPLVAGTNVKELFFHRPDNSFPSDHSAFFFGMATYAYLLGWRRTGHGLLVAAILVSIARIATGTHWFTDIIFGALVGLVSALLLWWLRKPFEHWLAEPIEAMLSKVGL